MIEDDRIPSQPDPDFDHPTLMPHRETLIPEHDNEWDKDRIKERYL